MCRWRMIDSFAQHLIVDAMQQHKEKYEDWNDGRINKYWLEKDDNGMTVMCIEYENGNVWHYHRSNKGDAINIF